MKVPNSDQPWYRITIRATTIAEATVKKKSGTTGDGPAGPWFRSPRLELQYPNPLFLIIFKNPPATLPETRNPWRRSSEGNLFTPPEEEKKDYSAL